LYAKNMFYTKDENQFLKKNTKHSNMLKIQLNFEKNSKQDDMIASLIGVEKWKEKDWKPLIYYIIKKCIKIFI